MSSSMVADWLALTHELNRQAFGQPPGEHWLHSFLETLRERIPAIGGIQVVQVTGNAVITQATSGTLRDGPNDLVTRDADSPVTRALESHQPQLGPDLRVYPIQYGADAIGALIVYTSGVPQEIDDTLSAIAIQLGPVFIREMRDSSHEGGAGELEQIAELSRRVMSTLDQTEIMRIVAAATPSIIAVDGISVALRWPGDQDMRLFLFDQGRVLPPIALPFESVALRASYESRTPSLINDLNGSDRPDYQILTRHALPDAWESGPTMRTAFIVPLLVGGRAIGTYNLTRRRTEAFTKLDQGLAVQIAAQLAIAVENSRLFGQAAERVQLEQLRNQIGTGVGAGDLTTVVLETMQGIGRALGARRARVRFMPPGEEIQDKP